MNLKEWKEWVADFVSAVETRQVPKALALLMDALNNNEKEADRLAKAMYPS